MKLSISIIFFLNGFLTLAKEDNLGATIIFYYGLEPASNQRYEINNISNVLQHPKFNSTLPTTFFIKGWLDTQQHPSGGPKTITAAYLKSENIKVNLLLLDEPVHLLYFLGAVSNEQKLGPILAQALIKLFESGLNIKTFHLIGHSIGGQLAGLIGRNIISSSNRTLMLPRITALDPASVPFYFYDRTVNKDDAIFVDIIHTDAGDLGNFLPAGTADFWPNGGTFLLQPGCPLLSLDVHCSHFMAVYYFAESVRGKYEEKFLASNTNRSKPIEMGINCPLNAKGNYFLETNADEPFAKDTEGIRNFFI